MNAKFKVSFITVHVGGNFGSNLQAIATSEVLKQLGTNPICVNYIPPRVMYERYWKVARKSIKKFIKRILYFPIMYISRKKFENYLSGHCNISRPIYASDDFSALCPKADIYLTGSDQVWNFTHNEGLDTHYFFDGVTGKKIAFSSSIGKEQLPDEEFDAIKRYTTDYSSISVRESSAVELFDRMGRKAFHTLDPTLMLDLHQWTKFASKRLVNKPYLFVYLPYNTADKELCYRTARKIAKTKGLLVVSSCNDIRKEKLDDVTIKFVNPGGILSLILYADVVLTNSFHGTAFSINLNKDVWIYMPSHFSTRIESIVSVCGLQHRILTDEIDDSQISQTIDYVPINDILNAERQKSLDYLKTALQEQSCISKL